MDTSCRAALSQAQLQGLKALRLGELALLLEGAAPAVVRSPIRTKVPAEFGATWPMPAGVLRSVVLVLEGVVPIERKLFAAMLAVPVARAARVLNDLRRRQPEKRGPSSGIPMHERFRAAASGVEHGAFS